MLLATTHGCLLLLKLHSDVIEQTTKKYIIQLLNAIVKKYNETMLRQTAPGEGGTLEEAYLNCREALEFA